MRLVLEGGVEGIVRALIRHPSQIKTLGYDILKSFNRFGRVP